MSFTIEGEHNTATVHGSKEQFDSTFVKQVQQMVDHEALSGDSDIKIMPDGHAGAGAVIGFTMPLKDKLVPNIVGVDCGCGMQATNYGPISIDLNEKQKLHELDQAIRNRIPMGFDVHDRNDYHMKEDFPWDACSEKLGLIDDAIEPTMPNPHETYGPEFFEDVCQRVGYDQGRAINSIGTLGGGNHFIELGSGEGNGVWSIIHSGSRGIGATIAEHWQEKATEATFERNAEVGIPSGEVKYFDINDEDIMSMQDEDTDTLLVRPSGLNIDREAILEDYDGEAIEGKFGQLKSYVNAGTNDSSPLDYLEGDEMVGYIVDMVFAQTYASESRKQMEDSVAEAIGSVAGSKPRIDEGIESVHNYIDFQDGVVRKGACAARNGETLVVPFNMQYGSIIARGRGKRDWNNSSAHGAGRAMSRTEAHSKFSAENFEEQTRDVYMSKQPMDEIPGAYKNPEQVEQALGDSVEVINRVKPVLSIKAE